MFKTERYLIAFSQVTQSQYTQPTYHHLKIKNIYVIAYKSLKQYPQAVRAYHTMPVWQREICACPLNSPPNKPPLGNGRTDYHGRSRTEQWRDGTLSIGTTKNVTQS